MLKRNVRAYLTIIDYGYMNSAEIYIFIKETILEMEQFSESYVINNDQNWLKNNS